MVFEQYMKMFFLVDIFDILIVAFLIYKMFMLIKDTRAEQLLKGVIILFFATGLSKLFGLTVFSWVLEKAQTLLLVALPIVFQPELRRMLEKLGRGNFLSATTIWDTNLLDENIANLTQAVSDLAKKKTGALIAVERKTGLSDIIETGTVINAKITKELIKNIFYPNTPLHDGAVILRDNRVYAAGCFLPLSTSTDINKDLGTRHRAAIGLSENSDSIVIVVSEETGTISIAEEGVLNRHFTQEKLEKYLLSKLKVKKESLLSRVINWRNKGGIEQ